jgi:hypothetical protein
MLELLVKTSHPRMFAFVFQVPLGLLITFAVCTVLLIAVHMLALMISTCILPNVEAVANLHFQTQKTVFESPHMKMSFIVELAWGFSTVLGKILLERPFRLKMSNSIKSFDRGQGLLPTRANIQNFKHILGQF